MSTPTESTMAGQPATGVIHDIGYRHYEGERLGRGAIARSLYVDSLRGAFGLGRSAKSKIAPFLLLAFMTIPALAVAIIVNVAVAKALPFPLTQYASFVYILVCLYVGGQAPASVSRDLRFRVTSLYFSRPLRRADYVGAKFAALTTAVAIVLIVPLIVLLAGALLSPLPKGDSLTGFGQALVGVAVLAAMVAGVGLAIASVTPRRGIGVGAIVAVLIVLWGVEGAVQGVLQSQGHADAARWAVLVSPGATADGVTAWLFGTKPASGLAPTTASGLVCLATAIVLAAGAYAFLRLRYRRVSVS